MALPILAKKVKKLASLQILNIKLLLNGRGLSKFKKLYRLKGEMGQGGFGVVYRAIRISDNLPVAVKFIERRHIREWGKLNDERVPMEICMLARCSKISGVIKLYDWFNLPEGYLIVMERPSPCIDLFDFIHNQHLLNENLARFIFRQIVQTAIDCAERKVLHRDIKDENVVIDLSTGGIRLIDFGAATLLKKTRYHDFQGTRLYCPPEWFLHSLYLGKEATVWSLGILLYNMLNGRLPFFNEKDICTAHLLGPLPFFTKLSFEARSLIEKCLNFDPFVRPSLESILSDEWMCLPTPEWLELSASTSCATQQPPDDISSVESLFDAIIVDNRPMKSTQQQQKYKQKLQPKNPKMLSCDTNQLGETKEVESRYNSETEKHDVVRRSHEKSLRKTVPKRERVESGLASSDSVNHDEDSEDYADRETEEFDCNDMFCVENDNVNNNKAENLYLRQQNPHSTNISLTHASLRSKPNSIISGQNSMENMPQLVNRRNAKTSVLKSPAPKFTDIYTPLIFEKNDSYTERFLLPKDNTKVENFQPLKCKENTSSVDSGTSSTLASPRGAPVMPYAF